MVKIISFFLYFYLICMKILTNGDETEITTTNNFIVSNKQMFENMEETTQLPKDIESTTNIRENDEIPTTLDSETDTTSTESVEETLQDLEEHLKNIIDNVFSRAQSMAFSMDFDIKVSGSCLISMLKLYFGIKTLQPWAFKVLDASGKPSAGLLKGTSTALGDYDECINTIFGKPTRRAKTAKYCLLEVKPPESIMNAIKEYQVSKDRGNSSLGLSKSFFEFLKEVRSNPNHIMYRMGICMPSYCSLSDVQALITFASSNLGVSMNVARCETAQKHDFKIHEILIMIFLSNIIMITIIGTFIQLFFSSGCCFENCRPIEPGPNVMKSQNRLRISKLLDILSDFSLCRNIKMLLDCTEEEDALDAIRGIKVLTVILAIYGHTYALPHPLHLYRFRDSLNFSKFVDEILFAIVANSSVGVDTFFFIAGFLFIYYRWRLLKRPSIGRYIFKFICINYIRMLAIQILVVFLFALLPMIGSGPLWHEFVEEPLGNCATRGWMNLLFIQNFLGPYDSCLYPSWILATMMQLFVLTAVIVWLIHKKPVIGISLNLFYILSAAIAVATVTILLEFPATFTMYFYDFRISIQYWKYLYVQSYNHLGPFCIGMLIAYLIAQYPLQKTRKPVVLFLWIVSASTCCAIIFGLFQYREGQNMDRFLAVAYATLHRPAWGLAIGWMVYACATNNGGIINSILSWKALIPLERLCYLAFLLHIPLMYYHGGVQRERMYMGHYSQTMAFLAYLTASFLLSFVCYVFFQCPYETVESYLFGKPKINARQENIAAISTETLKTPESERQAEEENSKVLFSRKF